MAHAIPGRTLASLKIEARRWLNALQGKAGAQSQRTALQRFQKALSASEATSGSARTDASVLPSAALSPPESPPGLREVQHALAREYGFKGWADLKASFGAFRQASLHPLALYEEKAQALLDAYSLGTPDALERHYALTWHRRTWESMRSYVQLDLGKRPTDEEDRVGITLDDARYLIAIEHDFGSWQALLSSLATVGTSGPVAAAPVSVSVGAAGLSRRVHKSREWSAVMEALEAHEDVTLDAQGGMTDDILADVANIPTITTLKLSNSKALTDAGIRHLARMPQLRELDVSQTAITDKGLEVLRELPGLQSLSAVMTAVSDAGAAHVADCPALRELNLMWTHTGDGAIHALAGNQSFRQLWTGNNVTDAGLAALHQIPALKAWLGGEVRIGLLRNDAKPNHVSVRGHFTRRGLEHLRGLDGLFGLSLDDNQQPVGGHALRELVSLPRLGFLSADIHDDGMAWVAKMPRLQFLSAQDTDATDAGWLALSKSSSLEYIWGRRCHGLRTPGFHALSTMQSLRGLSVSCLNVSDDGIALLPDFPALRELMPMDIPDAGYRYIARCTNLAELLLMYCRDTTDAATEQIGGLKLKRYFNSYTTITDRTPEILSSMDSLEEITLDACNNLTNAGVQMLARLPRLQELRLSGNSLTSEVVSQFPERLAVHYSH